MSKFEWAQGSRCPVPADVFAKELEKLGEDKTPEDVVNLASGTRSPIRKAFQWNDAKAAHQHRLDLARYYMRSLRVIVRVKKGEERKFRPLVHVRDEEGKSFYTSASRVAQRPDFMRSAVGECLRQLNGLRNQYAELKELKNVWRALDKVLASDLPKAG